MDATSTNNPEFVQASRTVEDKLSKILPNEKLLELYGLYKQSIFGDNATVRPGIFNAKGRAKWDSWTKLKGSSREEAQKRYIEMVARESSQAIY